MFASCWKLPASYRVAARALLSKGISSVHVHTQCTFDPDIDQSSVIYCVYYGGGDGWGGGGGEERRALANRTTLFVFSRVVLVVQS